MGVPSSSRFKGYDTYVAQHLVLRAEAIRYCRERWLTPDGRMLVASLPGVDGHFGPELQRFVLLQHHQGQVTVERLVAQLQRSPSVFPNARSCPADSGAGQLSRREPRCATGWPADGSLHHGRRHRRTMPARMAFVRRSVMTSSVSNEGIQTFAGTRRDHQYRRRGGGHVIVDSANGSRSDHGHVHEAANYRRRPQATPTDPIEGEGRSGADHPAHRHGAGSQRRGRTI